MINIFIISAYERFNIKNGDNHKFFNIFITLLGWQSFLKYTLGRIVFWAQLGPKINKWSIYVTELIERL